MIFSSVQSNLNECFLSCFQTNGYVKVCLLKRKLNISSYSQ